MIRIALILLALVSVTADACVTRSRSAKAAFARRHACPSTHLHKTSCPGHVIDHIKALACGGKDAPENMQWQTIAEGKAKDKWERKECGK